MNFDCMPRFKAFQFEIVTRVPDWARVYQVPSDAIERQIGIAHEWARNNPKRAPKKDILRYLHNWMAIAHRSGSLLNKETHRLYKENSPEDEIMSGDDFKRMRESLKNNP